MHNDFYPAGGTFHNYTRRSCMQIM